MDIAVILYQHAWVCHLAALCIVTLHWSYSTEMMIIAVLLYVFFCRETALHSGYVKCIFALMAWSNGSLIFLSFILLGIPWNVEAVFISLWVAIEVDSTQATFFKQVSDIELQKRFADLWTIFVVGQSCASFTKNLWPTKDISQKLIFHLR